MPISIDIVRAERDLATALVRLDRTIINTKAQLSRLQDDLEYLESVRLISASLHEHVRQVLEINQQMTAHLEDGR